MSYAYDLEADALYVTVSDHPVKLQRELPNGVIVDLDGAGQVVGIDIMSPAQPWDPNAISERFELPSVAVELLKALRLMNFGRHGPTTAGGSGLGTRRPQLTGA